MKNTLVDKFTNQKTTLLKILMMLYNTCNNNCDFCFQKQFKLLPTIQYFKENVEKYIMTVQNYLKNNKHFDEITVNLMGGELFHTDFAIEQLHMLISSLSEYDIEVRIATNLLYSDMSLLYKTIEHMKALKMRFSVFSSYDFGPIRFNEDNFNVFENNIKKLIAYSNEEFRVGVEVTRTKYMLKSLLEHDKQLKLFEYITKHCNICIDELIGDFDYALSYEDSVQLWKVLIDLYKSITDLQSHFVDNGRNCLNVQRAVIFSDSVFYGCISLKYRLENSISEDKKNYAIDLMKHYGCINCIHYNKCTLKCPIERRYDKCDIHEVLDYITLNNIRI